MTGFRPRISSEVASPKTHREDMVSAKVAELAGIEVPTGLLIGGEWTDGRGGGTLPVIDPATEDPVAEVADGTVEDALDAVDAAARRAGRPGRRPRRGSAPRCCAGPSS